MPKPNKVIVKKERAVHTYAELWHASGCVLKSGIEEPIGSSWQFSSSALLTAFAFEAYLNHVGSRTIACWAQLDRLPPWSKFELLCETLGVKYSKGAGSRPLQTVAKLLDFRNTIAHGRSVELKSKPELRDADERLDQYLAQRLRTGWEELIQTKDFAQRARDDVETVLASLHAARSDKKEGLFTFGLGFHRATTVTKS